MGIEPMTSSLPRTRSTPELHRLESSGRRGSNSRHSAWKADALPTELLPLGNSLSLNRKCGGDRTRTYSAIKQQSYSLPRLSNSGAPP